MEGSTVEATTFFFGNTSGGKGLYLAIALPRGGPWANGEGRAPSEDYTTPPSSRSASSDRFVAAARQAGDGCTVL